ncbi:MAG: hypothetical protein GYA62_16185 [Bacteroidales bacterium]|nr:hypothetical protein [Bacteroidales bacterium]
MTKKDNIKKLLQSNKKELIIQGLNEFENNRYADLLPDVISLYLRNDSEINTKIYFLLTNMKQNSAVDFLISSLKNIDDFHHFPELIRSCWENGLDFSAHLTFFTNIFIRSSYAVAIESFTVIEENIQKATKEQVKECLTVLKKEGKSISSDKKSLYEALVGILEPFV